jgi:hypothetical protein
MEDTDSNQAERLSAKQKLKIFLFKSSDKIGALGQPQGDAPRIISISTQYWG